MINKLLTYMYIFQMDLILYHIYVLKIIDS